MSEFCSTCQTMLISSLTYQHQGQTLTSHYCTTCDCWQPEPKYSSTKWKPTPEDWIPTEGETPKERRERILAGSWRGTR